MKKLFFIGFLFQSFVCAQNFNLQEGDYNGTLTYLDYTSNTKEVLDELTGKIAILGKKISLITQIKEDVRIFADTSEIGKDGSDIIFGSSLWQLEQETKKRGKVTEWILTKRGFDGNDRKECTFKMTIRFQDVALTWRKEVKFDGEERYFTRNQYDLRKVGTGQARLYRSYIGIGTDEFGAYPTQKFMVKGNNWRGTQVYVRIQLPEDPENRNFGFIQRISKRKAYSFSVPVGAKIWVCDDRYWDDYKPKEYVYKTVGALDGGEIPVNDLRFNARKL